MAYVAVKGGQKAIEASIERLRFERLKKGMVLETTSIAAGLRGLVHQVMSEASLYDETLAALAIKQGEGNPEEVVFLLRAFRSTLPRKYETREVQSDSMRIERRISASFKDLIGGQILGASTDYTHRLLDFDLWDEDDAWQTWLEHWETEVFDARVEKTGATKEWLNYTDALGYYKVPKVMDYLRQEGIVMSHPLDGCEPVDISQTALKFPAPRSVRLQVLTRGQTGAVTALGYASLRGFGSVHPTVGELRVGYLPLYIDGRATSCEEEASCEKEAYYIGQVLTTEVESIVPTVIDGPDGTKEQRLDIGYGICFGQNETKAIAMSILDRCLLEPSSVPTHDEEFVLYHVDSVEATGFISHLKLPHYVTFQAELDSVRKTKGGKGREKSL